jgi:hypothetical protein
MKNTSSNSDLNDFQKGYSNFGVIYIDAKSTDRTFEKANALTHPSL